MTVNHGFRASRTASPGHRRRDDCGAALVVAIAAVVVSLLLATTAVAVAVRSEASAASDRGRAQALAAAEAGLDQALLPLRSLDDATPSTFPCAPIETKVWSAPGQSTVKVGYAYFPESIPPVCPPAPGTVTRAEVVSTATYTSGSTTASRSMKGTVDLTRKPADSSKVFDEAMFTDGSLSTSGAFRTDGGVYTNGGYNCSSGSSIAGSLTAQGDFSASGPCTVGGDVLLGGNLSCSSGMTVTGSLSVAGTGKTSMSSCAVGGSASLGGPFSFSGSTRIGGLLTSASTSGSSVGSDVRITGAARLRSTVSGASASVFRGGLTQNATDPVPAAPKAPERQAIPVVRYVPADWSTATTLTAKQWAGANSAPGDGCSYSNRILKATAASTVVDATSCSGLSLSKVTFDLRGDLTIFTSGLSASSLKVIAGDERPHTLRIIEPARTSTAVCSARGDGISISGEFAVDSEIKTFLYTPGTTSLSGPIQLNGALYTCGASFSGSVTMNYNATPLPPVTGIYGTGYIASSATKSDVS